MSELLWEQSFQDQDLVVAPISEVSEDEVQEDKQPFVPKAILHW